VLSVVNADGTGARILSDALALRGAPAWSPDGRHLTVSALAAGEPRLFTVPLDGGQPEAWLGEQSVDPAWSPDGQLVVFSGADVGTTFTVHGARADGTSTPLPPLTLTRGGRHLAFLPQRHALLVLRGEIRHKNLWLVDLDGGGEQQVTDVGPEFELRDYDVSPDGRELVLEQAREPSDLVLIERAPR
jgi:Tol biopolymer transport system component